MCIPQSNCTLSPSKRLGQRTKCLKKRPTHWFMIHLKVPRPERADVLCSSYHSTAMSLKQVTMTWMYLFSKSLYMRYASSVTFLADCFSTIACSFCLAVDRCAGSGRTNFTSKVFALEGRVFVSIIKLT